MAEIVAAVAEAADGLRKDDRRGALECQHNLIGIRRIAYADGSRERQTRRDRYAEGPGSDGTVGIGRAIGQGRGAEDGRRATDAAGERVKAKPGRQGTLQCVAKRRRAILGRRQLQGRDSRADGIRFALSPPGQNAAVPPP